MKYLSLSRKTVTAEEVVAAAVKAGALDELLAALTKHHGHPVLPLPRVCKAFDTWSRALVTEGDGDPQLTKQARDLRHLIHVTIPKSNLLYRLLYAGETLRTERCPEHAGVWVGPVTGGSCECGGTGWLPMREVSP